jgi:hypothetical protein
LNKSNTSVKSQVKSLLKSDSKRGFLCKDTVVNKGRNLELGVKKSSMFKILSKTNKTFNTKNKAQDRYTSPNNDVQKFIKKHGLGPTMKQNGFNYNPISKIRMASTSHGLSFLGQSATKSTSGKFIKKNDFGKKRMSCNEKASRLQISSKKKPAYPETGYAAHRCSTNISHYASTSKNHNSSIRSPTDLKNPCNMFDPNKNSKTPDLTNSHYKVYC